MSIVKQGKLRALVNGAWQDVDAKLFSTSILEYSLKGKVTKLSITPSVTATPSKKSNFAGVFVVNTIPETYYTFGPMFAAEDPKEGERWMNLINLTRMKNNVALIHPHTLTLCTSKDKDRDCYRPSVIRLGKGTSVHCSACAKTGDPTESYRCELCKFELCADCHKTLGTMTDPFVKSPRHEHPLLNFAMAFDPQWFTSDYNRTFNCHACKKKCSGTVYHCAECGNYDECGACARDVTAPIAAKPPVTEPLNVGYLQSVVKAEGNKYALIATQSRTAPQAMSMIAPKHWDLSSIERAHVPHAYFEVTFTKLNSEGFASVGIGNQIFVQNQLLGYQQNTFGYLSSGEAAQNVGSNSHQYPPYAVGDTIGVGLLLDSFNQRRLFFTKNGQLLECFPQRVHIGMDCFPGVSFTKTSGVEFVVNMSGPFQFDASAIPDCRADKTNRFQQTPGEIVAACLSLATTQPANAFVFRQVSAVTGQQLGPANSHQISKQCAALALSNTVWKPLFLQVWPMQNSNLKLKSWHTLYKRRHALYKPGKGNGNGIQGNHLVENCDLELQCPLLYENMTKGNKEGERHCDKCQKTVYQVEDQATLSRYAEMGRCVSLVPPPLTVGPIGFQPRVMGLPPQRPPAVPKPFANAQPPRYNEAKVDPSVMLDLEP